MNLKTLALAIIALALAAVTARAGSEDIPDSLLTEDKVYELTFTDPDLAHHIVDAMRERTDISDYDLNQQPQARASPRLLPPHAVQ